MKKYLILFALLFIILAAVASALLLPAYVYNHYEYEFRTEYKMAEALLNQADEGITIRQAGPVDGITREQLVKVGEAVEDDIYWALEHLKRAQEIAVTQSRIPLLLPAYREYHHLKTETIAQLITSHTDFQVKKKNDHLLTNLYMTSEANKQLFNPEVIENDFWTAIDEVSATLHQFWIDLDTLKENQFISTLEYDYFHSIYAVSAAIAEQAKKVEQSGDWNDFDPAAFDQSPPSIEDLTASIKEMNVQRVAQGDAISAAIDSAFESVSRASSYYDEHQLNNDLLSKILRQNRRIGPAPDAGPEPAVMPAEMNEWRVS